MWTAEMRAKAAETRRRNAEERKRLLEKAATNGTRRYVRNGNRYGNSVEKHSSVWIYTTEYDKLLEMCRSAKEQFGLSMSVADAFRQVYRKSGLK